MGLITDYYDKENECEYKFTKAGPFWHLCTPGEGQESIFLDREDFMYAITALGIVLSECPKLRIYAFAIMNNHIHVILSGDEESCRRFFDRYMRLVKGYLGRKGRVVNLSTFSQMELIPITSLRMLRNEIVYVNRNGFAEGICPTPYSYPWGSGRFFFSLYPQVGREYNTLTIREKRKLTHMASLCLPDGYKVVDGYLNPESFCEFRKAESFFYDGQQYFSMLSKSLEAFSEIAKRLGDKVVMTDSEVYPLACSICKREYDVKSPSLLSPDEKIAVARQLHEKYHASNKQISRVLGLSTAIVDQIYPLNAARKRS